MNNADRPASPVPAHTSPPAHPHCYPVSLPAEYGLTKRERFCLEMGVADTGDAELDAIIRAGNRQRHAATAMQGILSGVLSNLTDVEWAQVSRDSVRAADALLDELERTS